MKKDINFEQLYKIWIKSKKISLKKGSISTYTYIFDKHLLPAFKYFNLSEITTEYILDFINSKASELGVKRLTDIITIMNNIISYAKYEDYDLQINKLPIPRKVNSDDIEIFNDIQRTNIINYLCANMNYINFTILLSLMTGTRIGEACALQISDFENSIVHISKTIERIKNPAGGTPKTILIIDTPKNQASYRSIPLPRFMWDIFCELYKGADKNSFIATNTEKFMEPRRLQELYKKMLFQVQVEYRKYHTLRHTFATYALRHGMDVKTLSELLGHTNVAFTIKRYVHSNIEIKREQMEKISS